MTDLIFKLWTDDQGQDIAEYAVMLAVILVIVVGTIRLIGSNANTVFSSAASSIQDHSQHHGVFRDILALIVCPQSKNEIAHSNPSE